MVCAHLARAASAVPPFDIHLRGTGTFRPVSPVVFVTLAEGISGCEVLADAVRQGPLEVDLHFPYHPHVTIAHHLDDADARPGLRASSRSSSAASPSTRSASTSTTPTPAGGPPTHFALG